MNAETALIPSAEAGAVQVAGSTRELVAASISENTRAAYTGALRRLDEALAGPPLTDGALAAYLSHLFESGSSPSVANQTVAAVKFRAKLAGQAVPVGQATVRVLAGFRRTAVDRGRGQVAGVRWEQADAAAALAANGSTHLAGLRDAAILAVMSDAMLRVSEVAALDVADVDATDSTVTVRRSKTDQEAAGAVLFLGPATLDPGEGMAGSRLDH